MSSLLAVGEGMSGGPFLRIAAQFEDGFVAEDACRWEEPNLKQMIGLCIRVVGRPHLWRQ